MLSSITELHSYIDRTQLTQELGGTQEYCHEKWISHRTVRTALHVLTTVGRAGCPMSDMSTVQIALHVPGDRRLCTDGEENGADAAVLWHRAGRDRTPQRDPGHHRPAEHTHRQEKQNEGKRGTTVHPVWSFFYMHMQMIFLLCVYRRTCWWL